MRNQKVLYNLLSNLILQVLLIIVGFIIPKMIIHAYGSSTNGLISSITQFLACLTIVEAGLSSAITLSLYKPVAKNDIQKINEIMSAAREFFIKSGYVFTGLVILLAFTYPIIIEEKRHFYTSFIVLVMGLSGVVEFFFIGKYRTLLYADQKGYILTNVQTFALISNTLIKILFIYLGFSILTIQIGSAIVYIVSFFLISNYIKRKYPSLNLRVQPDKTAVSQRWDILIHQLMYIILTNTPIIILSIFCSLEDISVYSIYMMILTAISGIVFIFQNGMNSYFGNVLNTDKHEVLINLHSLYENAFFMIITCLYCCTFVLIIPFIRIYTHGITDANYIREDLALVMVLFGLLKVIRVPDMTILSAAGHYKETKWRAITEGLILILTTILFVHFYGMVGVVLGGIISLAYRSIDIIAYTHKEILRVSVKHTVRKISLNTCLGLLSILPFGTVVHLHPTNYVAWFLTSVVVFGWIAIVILTGNFLSDRNGMKQLFRQIFPLLKVKLLKQKAEGM
ncbi:polysaccharide transport protein [Bacillus sp. JJ664]